MALERTPNDLHRSPDDPYRANLGEEELRRATRLDNELQMDPELAEGPASTGKIAMYALAIALVLGGLFYGLNSTSVNNAGTGTSSTAQNSPSSPPAAPPGMRDLTPRANTDQGVTTGAAPAQPKAPAPASPTPPTK
jgi:hypothetical protein